MGTHGTIFGSKGIRSAIFWLTVILVVAIDQATKEAVIVALEDGPQTLMPGVIDLVHVENTGAAFSIGEGGGAFFVVIAMVFLVASVLVVWHVPDLPIPLVVCIGLVAGGGMGNMVDRIMEGSVTDFLATTFMDFPVFNVADICVTVGVVCSVIGYLAWDSKREDEAVTQPSALRGDTHEG